MLIECTIECRREDWQPDRKQSQTFPVSNTNVNVLVWPPGGTKNLILYIYIILFSHNIHKHD